MPLPTLPVECFGNILTFLDNVSLYKCLFVNRYYCKLSIPIIWRDPFIMPAPNDLSLINTLISCLNEEEISSLIPYTNVYLSIKLCRGFRPLIIFFVLQKKLTVPTCRKKKRMICI